MIKEALECEASEEEMKEAIEKITKAWILFAARTNGLPEGAGIYKDELKVLSDSNRSVIMKLSDKCREVLLYKPVAQDRWQRPALDIELDTVIYNLDQNFAPNPRVKEYIAGKTEYWKEFVATRLN